MAQGPQQTGRTPPASGDAAPAVPGQVPTVTGGAMDILYFLPGGAIRFEPKPA